MILTLEEKLKYAKMHVHENVPISEIGRKYGFNASNFKYYVNLYLMYGEKAFIKTEQRRKYSREMKLNAIKEVETNNKSCRQVALELMLTDPKIVIEWYQKYKKFGEAGLQDTYSRESYKHHDDKILEKEYKKVLEDLERTKAENEFLKKSFPQVLKRSKQLRKKC